MQVGILFLNPFVKDFRVFSYNPDDIQKFHFWSQADSNGKDDVFIECNFAHDNGIKAGDTLNFKVDKEYREYFVSGIVSMPETLSVQPTDNSFGSNTDFGYAFAPVRLRSAASSIMDALARNVVFPFMWLILRLNINL